MACSIPARRLRSKTHATPGVMRRPAVGGRMRRFALKRARKAMKGVKKKGVQKQRRCRTAPDRDIRPPVKVCARKTGNKEHYIMQTKDCKLRFVITVTENMTKNTEEYAEQIAKEINDGRMTRLSQAQEWLATLVGKAE